MKARLEELYKTKIKKELQEALGLKNVMQIPKVLKVVLNVGAKDAVNDGKVIGIVKESLKSIAGQMPVQTCAHKSIASFKLREGMPIGVKVTLRNKNMYHFLDKLVTVALPAVKDFQGVSPKFDGNGNYNLGIRDWMVFPELDYDNVDQSRGMNISIYTSATTDSAARMLLEKLGVPFRSSH